jgi:hypothetical protein
MRIICCIAFRGGTHKEYEEDEEYKEYGAVFRQIFPVQKFLPDARIRGPLEPLACNHKNINLFTIRGPENPVWYSNCNSYETKSREGNISPRELS